MYNYWRHLQTYLIIKRKRLLNRWSTVKDKSYTPFIILCEPRSGSTLLHTYLNSHPDILSYGEALREAVEQDHTIAQRVTVDDLVFKPHTPKLKAVGVKIFYEYSDTPPYDAFFRQICDQRDVKVIHLTRSNLLDMFVSLKIAEATEVWSQQQGAGVPLKVNVDPAAFQDFSERHSKRGANVRRALKDHAFLDVTYEELTSYPKETLDQIQRFLSVKPQHLSTLLRKQNPMKPEEKISNYEDLRALGF